MCCVSMFQFGHMPALTKSKGAKTPDAANYVVIQMLRIDTLAFPSSIEEKLGAGRATLYSIEMNETNRKGKLCRN